MKVAELFESADRCTTVTANALLTHFHLSRTHTKMLTGLDLRAELQSAGLTFKPVPFPDDPRGYTIAQVKERFSSGAFYLFGGNHAMALIDGDLFDAANGTDRRRVNVLQVVKKSVNESRSHVLYHGSPVHITKFHELTHFGTKKAARIRLKHKGGGYLYTVNVSIKHPLRVTDVEASDEASMLGAALKGKYSLDPDTIRHHGLVKALQDAGYDGMVYKNQFEDAGQDSYVTTSPAQVKVVGVE